jgi:hypothetical protein
MENNQKNIEKILDNGKLVKKLNNTSINKFNSQACLYRWQGNQYVVRRIGKQYNLSTRQLVVLEKNLHIYYELLRKFLPIGLPKIFFTKIDKQRGTILLVTEYFSKRKIGEIKNASEKVKYFKVIAKLIIKLASSSSNLYLNKLICSIDPNPNNFFIDSKNKLIYNDFSPPLYCKHGKWFEFRRQDELHAQKSDKEKRYFTGFNLLFVFVNKTRIHLPFPDYLKFIKWICNEIHKSHLSNKNNIREFPEVFKKLYAKKAIDFSKLEKYAVLRDILRFAISFRKDLTSSQIKKIYKKSKRLDGIKILTKKLYEKN